jgi:hypothetical protein
MAFLVRTLVNTPEGYSLLNQVLKREDMQSILLKQPDKLILITYTQVVCILGKISLAKLMAARGGNRINDPLRIQIIKKMPDSFVAIDDILDVRPKEMIREAKISKKDENKFHYVDLEKERNKLRREFLYSN